MSIKVVSVKPSKTEGAMQITFQAASAEELLLACKMALSHPLVLADPSLMAAFIDMIDKLEHGDYHAAHLN